MKKKVSELQRGDKIDNVNEILTVEANSKGFWPGSCLITWRAQTISGKDWSNLPANYIVDVINAR